MKTQLYRHFDHEGKLLYVGISLSSISRLAKHKLDSHWFESIAQIKIESFETREAAILAERNAISTENPLHNLMRYKVKPSPRPNVEVSIRNLTKRIVQFSATYSLREVASCLGTSAPAVERFIQENKLGFINVPSRPGNQPRRRVTGWQLIDFIEYLQSDTQEKKT